MHSVRVRACISGRAALMTIDDIAFDPAAHVYTVHGRTLSGVTAVIARRTGKHYADGAGNPALAAACEHGTLVHETVSRAVGTGRMPKAGEARWVIDTLIARYGNCLRGRVMSEWLVSDLEHVASCIDLAVREADGVYDLYDIKTGKYDLEYCSWQLGFYAYMLRVSRGFVTRKCAILSTKDRDVYPVPPVSGERVKALIESEFGGK